MFAKILLIVAFSNSALGEKTTKYDQAIKNSIDYIEQMREELQFPGLVAGIIV